MATVSVALERLHALENKARKMGHRLDNAVWELARSTWVDVRAELVMRREAAYGSGLTLFGFPVVINEARAAGEVFLTEKETVRTDYRGAIAQRRIFAWDRLA